MAKKQNKTSFVYPDIEKVLNKYGWDIVDFSIDEKNMCHILLSHPKIQTKPKFRFVWYPHKPYLTDRDFIKVLNVGIGNGAVFKNEAKYRIAKLKQQNTTDETTCYKQGKKEYDEMKELWANQKPLIDELVEVYNKNYAANNK